MRKLFWPLVAQLFHFLHLLSSHSVSPLCCPLMPVGPLQMAVTVPGPMGLNVPQLLNSAARFLFPPAPSLDHFKSPRHTDIAFEF